MTTTARRTRGAGLLSIALSSVLVIGALGFGTGGATAGDADTALLPDLVVRPIGGVRVGAGEAGKSLRFDTVVGNRGSGPAELFPDVPDSGDCDGDGDSDDDRVATQRVFGDTDHDGVFTRGVDEVLSETEIGCFIFHPAHDHWHFEEFARYQLRRVHKDEVVRSAEKVSFCLTDTEAFGDVPGAGDRYYGRCDPDVTMGLSVGWSDLYDWGLVGQELSIKGLPDGRYCLTMFVDPGSRVEESNEIDNGRSTVVKIEGRRATDLDRRCPGEAR
ncbi:MAG TPA: lysyl oxidase family protein [Actinomycetota bacterium]